MSGTMKRSGLSWLMLSYVFGVSVRPCRLVILTLRQSMSIPTFLLVEIKRFKLSLDLVNVGSVANSE
jgi:hypothetical protein